MDKVKRIFISLLIIFISFFFIDEGKTVLLICDNIQIQLNHDQNSELEIPHQHHFSKSSDDEKWIKSNSFEILCSFDHPLLFHYYLKISSAEFTRSVWQPPKSL
jgi:hypothetical protein